MRSSTGKYYVGLDHIRAIAMFMVFTWHFTHFGNKGYPVPLEYVPYIFPFSLLNEGHTGVALFMTLSGYLFAKLLDGKKIKYVAFFWNRLVRLAPLLILVIIIIGFKLYLDGSYSFAYVKLMLSGIVLPVLPNGGWSITIEFHFYLLLPLLLWLTRKSKFSLIIAVCVMVMVRLILQYKVGQIQPLAYFSIVGRLDQFLFGMIAYRFRNHITGRHFMAIGTLVVFLLFYWYFDNNGGFYNNPSYPSSSAIWVFMPTIEGMAYGLLIAWYDNSFSHSNGIASRLLARIGAYSYSIYIFHYFVVFRMSRLINEHLINISNFYLALCFSVLCFLLMLPIGYLSFRFIESPFLKLRTRYMIENRPARQ